MYTSSFSVDVNEVEMKKKRKFSHSAPQLSGLTSSVVDPTLLALSDPNPK